MVKKPQLILVPVDGSDGADAAAAFAATLAQSLGTPIRLLFAFPKDPLHLLGLPAEARVAEQLSGYAPEAFADLRQARAERVFKRARSAVDASAVTVDEAVLDGDPAASILAHAAGEAGPMIVMGSRGLSPVSRILVGSVSQRVLSQATCPVTIVHR